MNHDVGDLILGDLLLELSKRIRVRLEGVHGCKHLRENEGVVADIGPDIERDTARAAAPPGADEIQLVPLVRTEEINLAIDVAAEMTAVAQPEEIDLEDVALAADGRR